MSTVKAAAVVATKSFPGALLRMPATSFFTEAGDPLATDCLPFAMPELEPEPEPNLEELAEALALVVFIDPLEEEKYFF